MNINYAALALVVDRSGSMHSIANDVRGSVKQFISEQKKNEGGAYLTVAQFDNRYDVVHDFTDIKNVDENKFANEYAPRGSTALLDAIGRTTLAMQQKLDSMPEADRPKRVVLAVITDGLENSSCEFSLSQIKDLIKKKEEAGWDYMFLGATLDTIDVAGRIGFSKNKTAVYTTSDMGSCMKVVNEKITQARLNKEINITEEERHNLMQNAVAQSA